MQFTPHVTCIDAALHGRPQAVLMEVAASLRLWGGLPCLLETMRSQGRDVGLSQLATGSTGLVALARLGLLASGALENSAPENAALRSLASSSHASQRDARVRQINDLPLHTLAAAWPHLQTLNQMGCVSWGQLAAMPRGGITRRFGASLLDALDKAYGHKSETYAWMALPEVFAVSHELHANVENASGLLFAASRQLKLLQAWLRARHQGVLSCQFTWLLDIRRHAPPQGEFTLQTAEPTQDIKHLERLLAEHLNRIELPAPAHTLQLRSLRCEALPELNTSLLPDEQRSGEPLHFFIERVASKLGADAICRPVLQADHRPEAAQRWASATLLNRAGNGIGNGIGNGAQSMPHMLHGLPPTNAPPAPHAYRPAWLMAQPLRLLVQGDKPYYQGTLKLLVGPERVESSCLVDAAPSQESMPVPVARDYFLAWSASAGLLWIFRERLTAQPGWYLHGLFA